MPELTLTADEARRIFLHTQGLIGSPYGRRGDPRAVLRHLGAVQLDTISVLARSHELVPYARLGAVGRATVESAYWQHTHAFEYWSHAACVLPSPAGRRTPSGAGRSSSADTGGTRWRTRTAPAPRCWPGCAARAR